LNWRTVIGLLSFTCGIGVRFLYFVQDALFTRLQRPVRFLVLFAGLAAVANASMEFCTFTGEASRPELPHASSLRCCWGQLLRIL
jgi:hypothetical protein